MIETDLDAKLTRYRTALDSFVEKLRQDRYVLAAVRIGSLAEAVIWRREGIRLWIIETDGVSRRHASDGKEERLFRTLVESGVDLHAEIIPRSRFKRMIEGSSRTAFSHSFFAHRTLLFTHDESIVRWFEETNRLAGKDQNNELLIAATWVAHGALHAEKLLVLRQEMDLTFQELLGTAWGLAALEIVRHGEVWEEGIIHRARELNPELFGEIYDGLLAGPRTPEHLRAVLDRIHREFDGHLESCFEPLLRFLKKEGGLVPLSRIADHFAYGQLYPWHLKAACHWLEKKGIVDKFAAPYRLTTKSRVELEEPAYVYEP